MEASNDISSLVRRAQYKKAYGLARELIKKYPENRFAQYRFAVLSGDSGEWARGKELKNNTSRAVKILKKLLLKTSGIDRRWVSSWRNEYYWFSSQPEKQYRLGKEDLLQRDMHGYYSMGVGAVSVALKKIEEKKYSQSIQWAQKAKSSWENYFKAVPDYYNAYVWYAKSLGLLGDLKGMEKALKKAGKLAKRPLSYREFVEARAEVLAARKKITL